MSYGLSECSSIIHFVYFKEDSSDQFPIEKYGDHLEFKIVDINNPQRTVPYGEPGELCVRGYITMLGYWNNKEKTDETIGADKWLKTGDIFVFRENSYGEVVGRIKEMILRGGENIYPKEIEDVLNTHPDILEAYVIGLDHERLGEEVCACVTVNNPSVINLQDIKSFCLEKMAFYKIPTQLKILDSFPKTPSGKIVKSELKKLVENKNE